MKPATFTEIRARLSDPVRLAVSIYMPNRRAGTLAFENRSQLRHLLRVAEIELTALGLSADNQAALLDPARALVDDAALWREPPGGLAFFLTIGSAWVYELREAIGPAVFIGNHFHVKPLWPLVSDRLSYYLLALSPGSARLFLGNENGLTEAPVEALPHPLADSLRPGLEPRLPVRVGAVRRRGLVGFVANEEPASDQPLSFCGRIDAALGAWLPPERPPLVLAGVRPMLDLYRQASRYPTLVEAEFDSSVDRMDPTRLHAAAWDRLSSERAATRVAALSEIERLAHSARVSTDLRKILPGASHGQVASLFVALDRAVWGLFDPETDAVRIDGDRRGSGLRDDLLDVAAGYASTTNARVFALPQRLIPGKNLCAAVLRF